VITQHEFFKALKIALHVVPDVSEKIPALGSLLFDYRTPDVLQIVGCDGERMLPGQFQVSPPSARKLLLAMAPGDSGLSAWSDEPMCVPPYTDWQAFRVLSECHIESVDIHINGLTGPGYITVELSSSVSVQIGLMQRAVK
jgi:hypothetical protein